MVESSAALMTAVRFFETISLTTVEEIDALYEHDAYFKDPFNEVRGVAAIQAIFAQMFVQVSEPRFKVVQSILGRAERDDVTPVPPLDVSLPASINALSSGDAFLIWEFSFRFKRFNKDQLQMVRGSSHLRFNRNGKIIFHRDYWDAAEELYEKIPILGALMRFIKLRAQH
jgi:steroid Delta-isomerase